MAASIADAVGGRPLRKIAFKVAPSGKTGTALVAESALQRARGLRGGDLGSNDAMLFAHPEDHTTPMTMQGVDHDLDVAWLDESGWHLGHSTMYAGQGAVYPPGPYRHAMEFPAGGLARFGVTDGSRVTFEDDGEDPAIVTPHVDPGGGWAP